jgi:hypothetical protein
MLRKFIPIMAVLALLLSACGADAAPTMSAEEVQGTAVAAAWTMVAATQEAIPTNTPIPPTETPSPTPDIPPTPTLEPLLLPTATELVILPTSTSALSQDACNRPLNIAEAGPQSRVRFNNRTGGTITSLSIYLNPNAYAQCGYIVTTMSKNQVITLSLPKGDYWIAALINLGGNKSSYSSGPMINKVADNHLFDVMIDKNRVFVP